jgi:endonuclease-3
LTNSKPSWPGTDPPPRLLKARVARIARRLEKEYGLPLREDAAEPLDTLVLTILSQNTNDRNRDRACGRLRERFPRWDDVLAAERGEIVEAIRPGGLAVQKAGRIVDLLREVEARFGSLSLAALKGMDSETVRKRLGGLKGVGPKTLHCLLLFGLAREVFPVDTHVLRTGKRLGFIPPAMGAEKAHAWMAPLVPGEKSLSLHVNLIRFGRAVCRARAPRCDACFLTEKCLDPKRGGR